MVNIDYHASVGYALELLAQSEYHRQFPLGDYFRVEIGVVAELTSET